MIQIRTKIDPCGHYPDTDPQLLVEACGLLPYFVLNDKYLEEPALTAIEGQYLFGSGYYMEGEVGDDGVYRYPEDEDLYPYLYVDRNGEDVYIYPYGIIAVKDGDEFKIQRMD